MSGERKDGSVVSSRLDRGSYRHLILDATIYLSFPIDIYSLILFYIQNKIMFR